MTRVLGAERVPAGFTITTEACVAYMKGDQEEPDGHGRAGRRRPRAARGAGGQEARRQRRPAAGQRPLGRPRVDAGHARHGPQPRPQRRVGRGSRQADRERPLRLGLLPALRADVRQRRARDAGGGVRGGHQGGQDGARGRHRHRARHRRPQGADREVQGGLPGAHRRRVPPGPAGAAQALHPRGVRLLDRRARRLLPAAEPHPRRLGHRGQRAADGVRQQGRRVRHRRGVQPRRGDRRARAVRRLPRQRPGRGRRLRRAQHARHRRAQGRHARGAQDADGDPRRAREALQGHAGHRVHDRGRAAVHAADAQRQAPRPGGRALRLRRRRRGAALQGGGAHHDRSGRARRAPAPDVRPEGRVRGAGERGLRLAGRRQGRDRLHRRGGGPGRAGRARRDPRAARSRRPTTSRASTPPRGS